jgi:hypothetical protein
MVRLKKSLMRQLKRVFGFLITRDVEAVAMEEGKA